MQKYEKFLELRDISLSVDEDGEDITLLHTLNFSAKSSQVTAMVGESGAGKTLTMRLLASLLPKDRGFYTRGSIVYGGQNYTQAKARLPAAMIFQDPKNYLNPSMSIGKQLEEILRYCPVGARFGSAPEIMDAVGLPRDKNFLGRFSHELSGGMQQRMGIAMVIASDSEIIIADEVVTALDTCSKAVVLDLLAKLAVEQGKLVFYISHDLKTVQKIADRILVMYAGHLVEDRDAANFFAFPCHPYSKDFMGAYPALIERGKPLQETPRGSLRRFPQVVGMELENPVLELRSVSKRYRIAGFGGIGRKTVEVLENISLKLLKGEILSIIGESGAGKTTLGRLILRRERVDSGEILYEGRRIQSHGGCGKRIKTAELYSAIQYVPQSTQDNLNPYLLFRDHLAHILARRGIAGKEYHRRMREIVNHCGLDIEFYDRFPSQLSGGQKQRLLIAKALAMEPRVIIFDEPVASLDASIQTKILNTLVDLKNRYGLSFIFITHDLDIAGYISDRIAVLHGGRIVECASVEEVVASPQHEYTAALLGAAVWKEKRDR